MPLSAEALEEIRGHIEEAEKIQASLTDIITDLRASGIDASKEEERLRAAEATLRQMQLFYGKQKKRIEAKE